MYGPLVSIITPVYGVELYLHDYLNSVLNQTYENLEIICVDDGSPDRCGDILDEFSKKDSRLKVIHQKNAGYTSALNRALDFVTGQYVGFIDPDDWTEFDFYEKTVDIANYTGADIVISNFYRETAEGTHKMYNSKTIQDVFESKVEAFRYGFEADVYRGFKMYMCNKLFSSKFFMPIGIGGFGFRMNSGYSTGSDILLASQCFLNAKRFAYTPEAFYHYRIRENSLVRNKDFNRRLGLNRALEDVIEELTKRGFSVEIINLVKRFHTYYCSQLAEFAYSIGDRGNLNFSQKELRKYLEEYVQSSLQFPDRIDRVNKILNMEIDSSSAD